MGTKSPSVSGAYDDTPDAAPSCRLWGHWNDELPGNIDGYSGSASGESDYGPGEGWDYTSFIYTVADGHTGLVIEARTYSSPGDIVWLDDLHVEIPGPCHDPDSRLQPGGYRIGNFWRREGAVPVEHTPS